MQKKYRNLFRKKQKSAADVGEEKGSPVRDGSSGAATPVGVGHVAKKETYMEEEQRNAAVT